jgi:hypothetical protein
MKADIIKGAVVTTQVEETTGEIILKAIVQEMEIILRMEVIQEIMETTLEVMEETIRGTMEVEIIQKETVLEKVTVRKGKDLVTVQEEVEDTPTKVMETMEEGPSFLLIYSFNNVFSIL